MLRRLQRKIFDFHRDSGNVARQGGRIFSRNLGNSRDASHLTEQFVIKADALTTVEAGRLIWENSGRKDVLGLKAGVDLRHQPKALDQESRAKGQCECECDLTRNQRVT
jgi:hypothetical protein